MHETVRRLAAAGPSFLSVTYGAGAPREAVPSRFCGSSVSRRMSSRSRTSPASETPMPARPRSSGSSWMPAS
nr:methylenetetrahydrofolate reductase [Microbacterium sp. NIBRBAC000506063]